MRKTPFCVVCRPQILVVRYIALPNILEEFKKASDILNVVWTKSERNSLVRIVKYFELIYVT